MTKFMKHFLLFAMLFSTGMYADGHTDAEATVLKNIVAYWGARNDRDWRKMAEYEIDRVRNPEKYEQ